jgi:hypothetical protein
MRRRLLNFLTALSLLLCLATGAAWASCRQSHRLPSFTAAGRIWRAELVGGSLCVYSFNDWPGGGTPAQKWGALASSGLNVPRADFELAIPGCGIASGMDFVDVAGAGRYWGRFASLGLRLWLLTCLAGALPLARLASAVWRSRDAKAGHCRRCGYDLRATPDRCTECGSPT